VKIPPEYPEKSPEVTSDLPQEFQLKWSSSLSTLQDIVVQYQKAMESYMELWKVLQDLDENCWILEPERFGFKNTFRRIALGEHLVLDSPHTERFNTAILSKQMNKNRQAQFTVGHCGSNSSTGYS
jgi:hypothetical protein